MPKTSIVREIYKWKPAATRPVGRPKSRWEDDVRNDLRKMRLENGQNKSRIALNGRVLLRKPRPYQSCSAEEEEGEEEEEGGGEGEEEGDGGEEREGGGEEEEAECEWQA